MGTLFVLLGPTGVGKTELSLGIADMLGCAVISSDSRQIYREISIGTAKPSPEDLARTHHYFISTRSVTEHYSSGQYELDAIPIIHQEIASHGNALLVGGSMLYIDAICRGIDDIPAIDPEIRSYVWRLYGQEGLDAVRSRLQLLDPTHYRRVDPLNAKRIVHALEVCLQTGRPFSSFHTGTAKKRDFHIVKIGLNRERNELYRRINLRVDQMVSAGLAGEAGQMYPLRNHNALNTVGYKEYFALFDGLIANEDTAIDQIKTNTRRYAKKQLSWFNRDKDITWFHPDQRDEITNLVQSAAKRQDNKPKQ